MILVEKHIVNKNNEQYKNIDNLCFLSKNLYNSGLYYIKKHYEETGKTIRYNELDKIFNRSDQYDYRQLPACISQQVLILLDNNINCFFKILSKWKKNKKNLQGCPQFPKYKHKIKGRNIVILNRLSLKKYPFLHFPKKSNLQPLKTKIQDKASIKQVRIIPQASCYTIEVVYEVPDVTLKENKNRAAIDIGVNNLAALTFSNNKQSYLINGKPLKSINQFYNKRKSEIQSDLEKRFKRKQSNRLNRLTLKRNNKIQDYLHKSSKFIIDKLIENNTSELIIGYNKEWKQNVNIGSKNNQNFCSIPFNRFMEQLTYKGALKGIKVSTIEESYTSKCSALDFEPVQKQTEYFGKRIQRGLFQTSNRTLINADINASLNIGRKVVGNRFMIKFVANRGCGYHPIKASL